MPAEAKNRKACSACGVDVTFQKRVNGPGGTYLCAACAPTDAAAPTPAPAPASHPVELKPISPAPAPPAAQSKQPPPLSGVTRPRASPPPLPKQAALSVPPLLPRSVPVPVPAPVPVSVEPLDPEPPRGIPWWAWTAGGLLVFAVILGVAWIVSNRATARSVASAPPVVFPSRRSASPTRPSRTVQWTMKTIPVNGTGVAIGPLHSGQTLWIRYLAGTWTSDRQSPPGSPDDDPRSNDDVPSLRVCELVDGQPVELAVVPGGTHAHPFAVRADHDIGNVVLDNTAGRPVNAKGSVRYAVRVDGGP